MENHKELTYTIFRYISAIILPLIAGITAIAQNPADSIPPGGNDNNGINTLILIDTVKPDDPVLPVDPTPDNPGMDSIIHSNPVPTVNPSKPDIPTVSNNYAVGTVTGSLSVNASGAAEYGIDIECPNGGSLTPQIGLAYNSQSSSNGVAGYGFSVTGLSSITRGDKTLFNNNGSVQGVTYTASDNLYLDGQRLILKSGNPCQEGATYCLEGNPYVVITAHGTYDNSTATTWFEVKTPDGLTYQYGNTSASRISFNTKNGYPRIGSWYVNRMEDVYGNYVTYTYSIRNYYAYPLSISYGMNSKKDRGIVNRISFEYSSVGANATFFNIGGKRGNIDQCITTITTSTNNTVYRKYNLIYDSTSDKSLCKYTRLTKIQEENGSGESLTPTELKWKYLPSGTIYYSNKSIPTYSSEQYFTETEKAFYAADLNGDGISDIIRVSHGTFTYGGIGSTSEHPQTRVYISRSTISSTGSITYQAPVIFTLPYYISIYTLGGVSLLDYDGDGYNDLVLSYVRFAGSQSFYFISGYQLSIGTSTDESLSISLESGCDNPLNSFFDLDGDGKDDFIVLEPIQKNERYTATVVSYEVTGDSRMKKYALAFPAKPEKMFCGDYNSDGLTDIIILYKGGYKIYFNNGGAIGDSKFTETNSTSGTSIGDQWRYQQGDFDGDGLIDFVYNITGESCLRIARNNGDGTFSCTASDDIGVADQATTNDNNRFTIMVYDINQDGRSDAVVCKAQYNKNNNKNSYSETHIKWLMSDGSTLRLNKSTVKMREDDANEKHIFLGDFNGDGKMELANYGSPLNSTSNTFTENRINLYSIWNDSPDIGRITDIIDGLGNKQTLSYAYTTTPPVYSRTQYSQDEYPVNCYTLPIPVVKKLTSTNGVSGTVSTEYSYKDLKIHLKGAGPLGFSEFATKNLTTGEESRTTITRWDEEMWIPTETKVTTSVGGKTSSTVSSTKVVTVGNTYFAYEASSQISDQYGNKAVTTNVYDTSKGVITEQTVKNDGDRMYKKVTYSGYQQKSGKWLPTAMVMTQKHEHDSKAYSVETRYSYDTQGNILTTTANYGTTLALTTTGTYDTYGNLLSTSSKGTGVKTITRYNIYDASGRFIIKTYTNPAASVTAYTYDTWGNLLTKTDVTDESNKLTVTNTYDNWGRLSSSKSPDGTTVTTQRGWGDTDAKKYYTLTSTTGQPWVLTWYDNIGHEVLQQTFGQDNVLISKTTSYNAVGKVSKIETVNGRLSASESFTYDDMGRILTDRLNSGKETTFSYGNRSVTTTSAGRSSTKTSDAWGNLLKSIDSAGGEVIYTYGSNGKPVSVTSNGTIMTFEYDEAGNRKSVKDPDAGTSTFEYAADGTILSKTDAKGVKTTNTYDSLGRLSTVQIGQNTIVNTYGTSGYENLRLVKSAMGSNSVEYTHDRYGRVLTEKRTVSGNGTYTFAFQYDDKNRLSKTSFPGGLDVTYQYDTYGFKTSVSAAGHIIYKKEKYTGDRFQSKFGSKIQVTTVCDEFGYISSRELAALKLPGLTDPIGPVRPLSIVVDELELAKDTLDLVLSQYDPLTDNMISRQRFGSPVEEFEYDNLDRLIAVMSGGDEIMRLNYASNGNILSKTGIGNYSYDDDLKPHAVIGVDNTSGLIPAAPLSTIFNDFKKIKTISDGGGGCNMEFTYGPDLQRWLSTLTKSGKTARTVIYARNYEKVTENGTTREFYYLDGNAIIVKENGVFKPYLAFTDNLGSILSVVDDEGNRKFEASYDAWGVQNVTINAIGLRRGYTGHEMLTEFNIINMNGRLYDPVLGRFFSPDPYILSADFTQCYNPYSYCLNNPLKYTDPSGNFSIPIVFGVFNLFRSMTHAAFSGKNIWKAAAMSLLQSAAAFGIGQAFGGVGSLGRELLRAGAHGAASGVINMLAGGKFGSGFAAGAISSATGSLTQGIKMPSEHRILSAAVAGGVAAWASGGSFIQGAFQGISIAIYNDGMHNSENENNDSTPKESSTPKKNPKPLKPDGYYINEQNRVVYELKNINYTGRLMTWKEHLEFIGMLNSAANRFGNSLENNAQNSAIGNNGMIYYHSTNERSFYGNQYVRTYKLSTMGSRIVTISGRIGTKVTFINISSGIISDINDYSSQGYTSGYHTLRASGQALGAWACGEICAEAGAQFGGMVGAAYGGIGAIPGAIIGGFVFGCIGAIGGETLIGEIFDNIYFE